MSLAINGTIRKGILYSANDKTLATLKRSSPEAAVELDAGEYTFQIETRGAEQVKLNFSINVSEKELGKDSELVCEKQGTGASCKRDGKALSANP